MNSQTNSRRVLKWLLLTVMVIGSGFLLSRGNTLPAPLLQSITKASKVTLLSLEPAPENLTETEKSTLSQFRGYHVLGRMELNAEQKQLLVTTLAAQVSGYSGGGSKCFDPRHAVQIETADGKTTEILICYACNWIETNVSSHTPKSRQPIKNDPATLNQLLISQHIRVAKTR